MSCHVLVYFFHLCFGKCAYEFEKMTYFYLLWFLSKENELQLRYFDSYGGKNT